MKKLLMMVAVALVGTAALADYGYLYWAVDQSAAESPIEFVYAQIKTSDGSWTSQHLVAPGGSAISAGPVNLALGDSDLSGCQFVVQLLDDAYGVVGASDAIEYAALAEHVFDGMSETGATPYLATAFTAVGPSDPGSEENPWKVGGTDGTDDLVEAWTNGAGTLVIQGSGTVTNLEEVVKDGITAINVADATVTGAAANAFAVLDGIVLTLPDDWQGELPDAAGNWYGTTVDMLNFKYPLTVRNVTTATHWPWDGKIDISCDLTGKGKARLGAALMTNGVTVCTAKAANLTGETVIDLDAVGGVTNGVKFVWDARQDCPAGFNSADTKVKVTAVK